MEITKEFLEKLSKVTGTMITEEKAVEINDIVSEANSINIQIVDEGAQMLNGIVDKMGEENFLNFADSIKKKSKK